jgi:hypothetical protein
VGSNDHLAQSAVAGQDATQQHGLAGAKEADKDGDGQARGATTDSDLNVSRFTYPARGRQTRCGNSLDPALLLESLFEHAGDFLGGLIGSSLYRALAALLAVNFHPATDDETQRVVSGK